MCFCLRSNRGWKESYINDGKSYWSKPIGQFNRSDKEINKNIERDAAPCELNIMASDDLNGLNKITQVNSQVKENNFLEKRKNNYKHNQLCDFCLKRTNTKKTKMPKKEMLIFFKENKYKNNILHYNCYYELYKQLKKKV